LKKKFGNEKKQDVEEEKLKEREIDEKEEPYEEIKEETKNMKVKENEKIEEKVREDNIKLPIRMILLFLLVFLILDFAWRCYCLLVIWSFKIRTQRGERLLIITGISAQDINQENTLSNPYAVNAPQFVQMGLYNNQHTARNLIPVQTADACDVEM